LALRSISSEKVPLSHWYLVGPNTSRGEVIAPYHIKAEVTMEVNSTAAILVASTDSMFDIASVLYRKGDGLDETCQTPINIPTNPATMWFADTARSNTGLVPRWSILA
jgi:hypothetical protein